MMPIPPPPPKTIPPPPAPPAVITAPVELEGLLDIPMEDSLVHKGESDEVRSKRHQTTIDTFVIKCLQSFEYFAKACLKIKTKTNGVQPLEFNDAQRYLDSVANLMLAVHGMVRIIIVKGRQQGLSTWVEGRGYWRTSQTPGTNAYILAHEADATKNLFNMAKRYHDHCPAELKPIIKKSNAKELIFSEMESEYAVGTAKTGDTGRGQTIHFFHGSEVGYWASAEEISDGVMEGVPEGEGTEIYLESTAKGVGNYFHSMWEGACYADDTPPANWNGYWRVFVPWFWEPGYRRKPAADFELTEEEEVVADLYKLDDKQMAWRRHKIATKHGGVAQFQREYPANPAEAFNADLNNALVTPEVVLRAMRAGRDQVFIPVGRTILGVDVAREGDDDTTLVLRQGRVILWYRRLSKLKTLEVANEIIMALREHHIDHVCIDATGGYGAGVYDVLVGYGFGERITPVGFAERAIERDRYKNRRTEMYWLLKEWLEAGAAIPDRDEWLTELCAITYMHDRTTDQLQLESKAEIKKRIKKSTDITDGAALTFCMPSTTIAGGSDSSFDPYTEYGFV